MWLFAAEATDVISKFQLILEVIGEKLGAADIGVRIPKGDDMSPWRLFEAL